MTDDFRKAAEIEASVPIAAGVAEDWNRVAELNHLRTIKRLADEVATFAHNVWGESPAGQAVNRLTAALAAGPQPADELAARFESMGKLLIDIYHDLGTASETWRDSDAGPATVPGEPRELQEISPEVLARLCEEIANYTIPASYTGGKSEQERLRKIILNEISRLEIEANSHEATDYGNRCREQAARLLGEMNA